VTSINESKNIKDISKKILTITWSEHENKLCGDYHPQSTHSNWKKGNDLSLKDQKKINECDVQIQELLKAIYDVYEELIPLKKKRALLRESIISLLNNKDVSIAEYRNLQIKSINKTLEPSQEDIMNLREHLTRNQYDYVFKPNITRLKRIKEKLNDSAKKYVNEILKKTKMKFI
jgi:hypothetical protein